MDKHTKPVKNSKTKDEVKNVNVAPSGDSPLTAEEQRQVLARRYPKGPAPHERYSGAVTMADVFGSEDD